MSETKHVLSTDDEGKTTPAAQVVVQQRRSRMGNIRWDILWERYGIAAILLVIWLLSFLLIPDFSNIDNFTEILRQSSFVGIAAVGMMIVILLGSFDLSVGSTLALCAWLTVTIAGQHQLLWAFVATLLLGCFIGAINGSADCLYAHSSVYRHIEHALHYKWIHLCDNWRQFSALYRAGIYTDWRRRSSGNTHSICGLCYLCAIGCCDLTLYHLWPLRVCRWLECCSGTYRGCSCASHPILFFRTRWLFYGGGGDIAGLAPLYSGARLRARLRTQRYRNCCAWWNAALRWTRQYAWNFCGGTTIHDH